MLTATIIIDNNPSIDNPCLIAEHGLSIFIETETTRLLCDMGASAMYRRNATELGVDLSTIDFAFVSHGHNDHTGGLGDFLMTFEDIPIYMSSHIFNDKYYSTRLGRHRDLSTDNKLISQYRQRFTFIDKSRWISEDIAIVSCESNKYAQPLGNKFLYNQKGLDSFNHELALAVTTKSGLVVVSSCSHCGAINIIESCRAFTRQSRVAAFIGGLHFISGEWTKSEVTQFISDVVSLYPGIAIYTGHCTSDIAMQLLLLGKINIKQFRTATTISVE